MTNELIELLQAAACPDNCEQGVIQTPDGIELCMWCAERSRLTEEWNAAPRPEPKVCVWEKRGESINGQLFRASCNPAAIVLLPAGSRDTECDNCGGKIQVKEGA